MRLDLPEPPVPVRPRTGAWLRSAAARLAEAAEAGHLLLFYHSTAQPAAFVAVNGRGVREVEPVAL